MGSGAFATDIPARLDRLRWSRFHTLLIAALGTSWIHRWAKTEGRPETFYFGEPRTPKWIVDLAGVSPSFE